MYLLNEIKSLVGQAHKKSEQQLFDEIKKRFTVNNELTFVGDLLEQAAQKTPTRIALQAPDRTVTYIQLYALAQQMARQFESYGVRAHDRVALYYENSVEFFIGYYASWMLHAVVIPINTYLHEKELAHVINDAEPKIIFTQPSFVSIFDNLIKNDVVKTLPPVLTGNLIDWNATVLSNSVVPTERLKPDDLALLLYTSGTTGVPKGVMLSSRNALTNVMQVYPRFKKMGLDEGERFLCVLPLFHAFAQVSCIWFAMLSLSTVIIVPRIERKLILEGLKQSPTVFLGFPALYGLLCMMKTAPLHNIKIFVSGADALPDKIRAGFAMIYGRRICSGYGLTEASPVVAVNSDNKECPTHEVGKALSGIILEIRDDNGKPVEQGKVGTLWIKGDNIMMGYYKSREATEEILVDGWLNTGDLVSLDKQQRMAIRGRSKDLIIHKGFNIYPQEIENVLLKHPHVFKAAVIGKAEEMSGQVVVAYVAIRNADEKKTEEELRKLCNEYLAAYKMPRQIICLEDLPMNATGKVDKKQLRQ